MSSPASALADMLIESEKALDAERSARIELELRLDSLTKAIAELTKAVQAKGTVAKGSKKAFNLTITGRDSEERITTFKLE